ncbi:hypothetical protein [Bartonella sp. AR 15-3]|uniref:hypothetical protein n=1 Tax=Bartonella sp. AR 15-3 TaxID=545617 RepID=UPI0001F4C245|nr:hypothetical protein [Bartonella sp. AR 15-3]OPB31567.1 hypothetical protein BAR153v2_005160 [Bartonella sp. AR 15-3]CBI79415.1 conserved hypothetical protein [Bartonella sp. AR 15-3]
MEQKKESFSFSKFFDPKFLRPLMHEVIPQLPGYFLKQPTLPDSSSAVITDSEKSDHSQKNDLSALIRGVNTVFGESNTKNPTALIMSTDDLKQQTPPLPDYSNYKLLEDERQNFPKQGVSLSPQPAFVSSIDKADENEEHAQYKNVMDYISEINRKPTQEDLQNKGTPLNNEEFPRPLTEERALQDKNVFDGRTAKDEGENGSNFWDRLKKSEFSEHLMDFFSGLSQGETPEESFSNAGIALRQGNVERAQRQQTLEFLRSKGYSAEDAKALMQYPDVVQKMIGNTLNSEEGYRTLTAEEKAEYGLPENIPFQVSSSGKIIPVSSPEGGYRTLTAEEKAEYGLPEDIPFQVSSSGKIIPVQGMQGSRSAAEAGYTLVKDKSTQSGLRAIPITGSAAERTLIKEKNEALLRYAEGIARGERLVNTSKDLMKILDENPKIVGTIGHLLSKIPGSDGADFAAILKTLKSNIAIDTLQKMKALAPNGASGFGNLSNVEFEALQNSIAALGTNLTAEQMKKSLQTIIETYSKANRATKILLFGQEALTVELVEEAYGITPDKQNDEKSEGSDHQFNKYFEALPEGMMFVDSDGHIKEKQING